MLTEQQHDDDNGGNNGITISYLVLSSIYIQFLNINALIKL